MRPGILLGPDWSAIREHATDIHQGFKQVRYPTREQREEAWTRFKAFENEAFEQRTREQKERRWKSEAHRNDILGRVSDARPVGLGLLGENPREELRALGGVLKEAGQLLSRHKSEMLAEHKQECFAAIQEMREIQQAEWDGLNRERDARRSARDEDSRARARANLEANQDRYRRLAESIERDRHHAEKLRADIVGAWTEGFKLRAAEWLAETEDRIASKEEFLREIERWIQEDERRLSQ